ncbi:MAG: hypothetical protein ABIQ10_14260 [Gemmatimonadaceae bacterium]
MNSPGELAPIHRLSIRRFCAPVRAAYWSLYFPTLTTDDTVRTGSSRRDGTLAVSLAASHECNAPLPLQNPTILLSEPCVTANFSTSASLDFHEPPSQPQGYAHFSFPAISLDGERLIVP